MTLGAYLRKHGISTQAFADKVNADRSQIYRAVRRQRRPGLELALRIREQTGGAVSLASWTRKPRRRPVSSPAV